MVLFLFDNVIYVFLLLWLCILIVCLRMTTLTAVFPCFFLSCKTNARVKSAKNGARPALFLIFVLFYVFFVLFYVFLCFSMYCLSCVVLCIVRAYMCTELLPHGRYPISVKYISYHITSRHRRCVTPKRLYPSTRPHRVTAQTTRQNLHHRANLKSCTEIIFCLSYALKDAALLNNARMESMKVIKRGPVNWRGKEFTRVAECIASIHGYRGSIYTHISGLCKGEAALNLFNKLDLTTFKPAGRHRTVLYLLP